MTVVIVAILSIWKKVNKMFVTNSDFEIIETALTTVKEKDIKKALKVIKALKEKKKKDNSRVSKYIAEKRKIDKNYAHTKDIKKLKKVVDNKKKK